LGEVFGVSTRPRVALQFFARAIRGSFLIIFRREKGSALLVRIPSLWAESGPAPLCLYPAIWKDETNSFAQPGFLFLRTWEFQQQWDSASERSRHPFRAFSLIATQIGRPIHLQRVPRPLAFPQA